MKLSSRTRLLAAAGLSLALALPVAALAWPGHGRDHDGRMQKRIEALDLDAATRAQVEAIFEQARDQRSTGKQEMRAAHEEMHALMRSGDASQEALMAQAEYISDLKLAKQKQHITRFLALRQVLTPEQLAEITPERHRGDRGDPGDEGCDSGRKRGWLRR